ncbi:MAG TPA: SDR family oxidoreductase [Solirubrobacteraceae bacterium]|jgi:7-alpha-hydroxysteroid dehydrogenase|nr:SDR family oxidoreductase [Solirubrobacteraceae bacterium]
MPPTEPDRFRLDGHIALITGASRGIGAAIASEFARAGADLALVARGARDLEALAAAGREFGRRALVLPADLTDLPAMARVIDATIGEYGRLDVLVNNAGGAAPMSFRETSAEQLEGAFRFNVSAPFELIKHATPHLLASPQASIVNVSSRMGSLSERGLITYGTVKAALSHMTRLLASELAPKVRVNGVAPAIVATDQLNDALDEQVRRQVEAATPLRRLASVEDVARTVRWLTSPAAEYITGKIIDIDGGAQAPTLPSSEPDLTAPLNLPR